MTSAVRQAYERFGVVSGVIHGAGNTSGAAFVEAGRVDRASGDQHFRPKAYGTFVLEEIFRDRDLDFVLLLSLSGVLGGLGLLGYASANVFLDAFAARENQTKRVPWIAVNWDAWQFPGQEAMFRQTASPGGDFLSRGRHRLLPPHHRARATPGRGVDERSERAHRQMEYPLSRSAPRPSRRTLRARRSTRGRA